MKKIALRLIVLMTCLMGGLAHGLELVDEGELAEVTGQEGIAIGIDIGVNTDTNGNPINCSGTTACRFAWNIAQRTDVWTVLKNSWMSLRIPALNIGVQPTMGAVGSDSSYFDASRFMGYNSSGATICLLPGADCSTARIDSLPALRLSYPTASYGSLSYDPGTQVSSGYSSLGLGLVIGRMSLEFGPTGYNAEVNTKPFLGLKIADNNGNFANMAIGGTAYVYGF